MKPLITFEEDIIDQDVSQFNTYRITKKGTLIVASIADLHFPANRIGPKTQCEILEQQFLQKIENLPKLDLVTIVGDLYDHKVLASSDAVLYASIFVGKLIEICKTKQASLIIIQGTASHDANQLRLYYHYMQDPSVDVRIVTQIQFEYVKGAKILCIPELYGIDESVYHKFLYGSGFYDMAFMHGTFEGAIYGNNVGNSRLFTMQDFGNCNGPIIAGHVHHPGCFSKHFYYCGSPYAWGFDDDHEKGFILFSMNLDNRRYYINWEQIHSFIYRTIVIDNKAINDPHGIITYIDKIKREQGIDFIRIRFENPVSKTERLMLSGNYRDDESVKIEFPDTEAEIMIQKQNEDYNDIFTKYPYLFDNSISDEERFCAYINTLKGDGYITVDELRSIIEDCI